MASNRPNQFARLAAAIACASFLAAFGSSSASADHAQFSSALLDNANTWPGDETDPGIFGQGFSPSLNATPDPGHLDTDMVGLDRFSFFKDGNTDTASDVKLAIVNNFYLDLVNLTTSRAEFVGISDNTINSTAGLAVGDRYTFEFSSLQLEYGADYGAIFVNDDGAGNLTPIKVSALTADYAEDPPESGIFLPVSNYGSEFDFQYSTSNFINSGQFGDFLNGFAEGGDAQFEAEFDVMETPGDFNGDGVVAGKDFLLWQQDPNVGSLADWETNYSSPTPVAGVNAIPEPSTCAIACVAGAALLAARRRSV